MKNMTGGEAVVESLLDHGIDTVFGIPGIQLDNLFDAYYAKRNQLKVVHTRHEQGAAFMAMGYAQSSGRTGCFSVVPGPGLLNALTAVITASSVNAPVLGLTGQIPSNQIGMGYGMVHELPDQLMAARGVIDWVERANHPSEVPDVLRRAFQTIRSGRQCPAIMEMAPDQLGLRAPVRSLPPAEIIEAPDPDPDKIEALAAQLMAAERPALFIGSGVFDAEAELKELVERLQIPVMISPSGLGALPSDHPLAFDMLSAQELWADFDFVLVIGTRFMTPALAWGRVGDLPVARIDIDPQQLVKPRAPDIGLATSGKQGLSALLAALPAEKAPNAAYLARCEAVRQSARDKLEALEPLSGYSRALRKALPRDGFLVTDVTQVAYYARFGFPVYEPRTFLLPGFQATLGWAYPASLGVKIANPDKKVVSVSGDGGFLFTLQEMATAAQFRIPTVAVVFDNKAYGNVKTIQAHSYGARHIAVDLGNPDFLTLAQAFGIRAERAETAEQLEESLTRLLAAEEPALIEVPMGDVPDIWQLIKRPPSQGKVGK